MKKLALILSIIVLFMTLSSCGYPEIDEQLQGVWVLKSSDFEAVHTFSFAEGTVNIHSENSYGKTGKEKYVTEETLTF